MRDNYKDSNYFNTYISEEKETIEDFKNSITTGRAKPDRHKSLKDAILTSNINIVIAQYSSGADKATITASLMEAITAFEEGFKWEGPERGYGKYEEMLWILCIAFLCDVDNSTFKRITNIIKRDNVKDKLLDVIINAKLKNEWPVTAYSYIEPSPYKNADNLGNATEIKNYLDKVWYQGQKDAHWHDSHKNTKVNVYFGYWAWETAAIAKIKNIDDSSLKDQKYYPYDAVHW